MEDAATVFSLTKNNKEAKSPNYNVH
jgi:hypothetical protein